MHSEGPTEADYAEGARIALDRRDMRLALEQIGGALSFRPMAAEHRAMLDLILSRTPRPLELLPRQGIAFFGAAAVRAWVLVRTGRLNEGILQLLDVAHFRPSLPYLVWLSEWREAHGLRGVAADAVATACGRFLAALDREGEGDGARDNVEAILGILQALREARPKAQASLATIEAMALRRLDRAADAVTVINEVLPIARSSALLVQKAQALATMGELEQSAETMREACRDTPGDAALEADLADALLLAGQLSEAQAGYLKLAASDDSPLRVHAELLRSYIASLSAPDDEGLLQASLARASAAEERARELVPLLWLYRAELPPVEDPLASALLDVLERVRAEPPKGPIRLRVKLDCPVPATARSVFAAGLAHVGQVGEIDAEGADTPSPLPATPVEAAIEERVRATASSVQTVDAWCRLPQGLTLADARAAAEQRGEAHADPIGALDRRRLAAFALAAAGDTDQVAVVAWLREVATGDDAWAARPALMVLAAISRLHAAARVAVRAAFESAEARADARRITLLGCWCLLPDLAPAERGARYRAWQEARIRRR